MLSLIPKMHMKKIVLILTLILICLFSASCGEDECEHQDMIHKVVPPLCDEAGYTLNICQDCDNFSYKSDMIPSKGHVYSEQIIAPDCENEGYTKYECRCGFSFNSNFTAPTGHTLIETLMRPTCTDEGYTLYTCECGYSYRGHFEDPFGHQYVEDIVPPTCENEGYTLYFCTDCEHSYMSDYISSLGHRFTSTVTPPTCTEEGHTLYTCDCGHSYTSDFTPALGHRFTAEQTPPTCTDEGYTVYSCTCGHSYTSNFVASTGHSYHQSINAPTCITEGYTVFECDCGHSYTGQIIAPLGHSFEKSIMMPTLSDMGYTEFICDTCGFSYVGDYRFYSSIVNGAYSGSTEVLAKGIDLSIYNYDISSDGSPIPLDFGMIRESGIDYVILKAGSTLRDNGALGGKEEAFEIGYRGAKDAGLDVGVYFYTYATTIEQIRRDAHMLVYILEGKQLEYPVYLDLEDDSLRGLGSSMLHQMCVEFFSILQRAGYYTGLYVNDEWLVNVINTEKALSMFDIWYARYPSGTDEYIWDTDEFGECLGMWQYTDKGSIESLPSKVFDLNFCYIDYPSIIREGGFNGYSSDIHFPSEEYFYVWIIANSLTVRSSSDFKSSDNILGYLQYGDMVEAIEQTDAYTKIIYKGMEAYISAKPEYVTTTPLF